MIAAFHDVTGDLMGDPIGSCTLVWDRMRRIQPNVAVTQSEYGL